MSEMQSFLVQILPHNHGIVIFVYFNYFESGGIN